MSRMTDEEFALHERGRALQRDRLLKEACRARASEAALVKVARTAIARLKDIETDTNGEQVSPRVIALLEAAISKAESSR